MIYQKSLKLEDMIRKLEEKTGKYYDHYRQEACFLRCEADMAEDDYKSQQRQKVFNKTKQ